IHDAQTRVLFSELEFFKLLQEMPPSEVTPLQVATEVIGDRAGLEEVVRAAEGFKSITLIPAFEGLPYAAELVGLGMALPDGRNFYVPLRHQYLGVPQQLAPDVFADVISALLENEEVRKNGHDLKSLILVLATLGLKVAGLEGDVELLSYLLNPSRREHALPDLARERLHAELPGNPTISAARKKPCPLVDVTVDQCAACY